MGGSVNSPALPFVPAVLSRSLAWTGLDWGGLWSLEAHSRYRGEHPPPSSLPASRWPLDVWVCSLRWASFSSSRQNGSWFTGQQRPTASYPSPPLPASPPSATHLTRLSPLPPPLPRLICHTPPTSGHRERSPPPSTPQHPPRPLPGTANILRPAFGLHYITQPAAPPRVRPSTTRPSMRLTTYFDPDPAPARPDCICGACSAAECPFTGRSRLVCSRFSCGCRGPPHRLPAVPVGCSCRCRRRQELHRPASLGDSRQNKTKHTAQSIPNSHPSRRQHQDRGPGRLDSRRNHDNRHIV
jgi:hypothetical protein